MDKMCFNKKRYPGMIQAFAAAGTVTARFGIDQRAYHCPICKGYHLTKKPRREDPVVWTTLLNS